jgi:hypothetical protein
MHPEKLHCTLDNLLQEVLRVQVARDGFHDPSQRIQLMERIVQVPVVSRQLGGRRRLALQAFVSLNLEGNQPGQDAHGIELGIAQIHDPAVVRAQRAEDAPVAEHDGH